MKQASKIGLIRDIPFKAAEVKMGKKAQERIVIIGLPGSGKSTFATKLGKCLGIPVYHLDRYMYVRSGEKGEIAKREKSAFLEIQRDLVNEESWVIEGCSISTLEVRLERATQLIYFRFPRFFCFWRVCKRFLTQKQPIVDLPDGSRYPLRCRLFRYIWNFEKRNSARIEELKEKYPEIQIHTFRNSKEAEAYFK